MYRVTIKKLFFSLKHFIFFVRRDHNNFAHCNYTFNFLRNSRFLSSVHAITLIFRKKYFLQKKFFSYFSYLLHFHKLQECKITKKNIFFIFLFAFNWTIKFFVMIFQLFSHSDLRFHHLSTPRYKLFIFLSCEIMWCLLFICCTRTIVHNLKNYNFFVFILSIVFRLLRYSVCFLFNSFRFNSLVQW